MTSLNQRVIANDTVMEDCLANYNKLREASFLPSKLTVPKSEHSIELVQVYNSCVLYCLPVCTAQIHNSSEFGLYSRELKGVWSDITSSTSQYEFYLHICIFIAGSR